MAWEDLPPHTQGRNAATWAAALGFVVSLIGSAVIVALFAPRGLRARSMVAAGLGWGAGIAFLTVLDLARRWSLDFLIFILGPMAVAAGVAWALGGLLMRATPGPDESLPFQPAAKDSET